MNDQLFISNVYLWDGYSNDRSESMNVLVEGNIIKKLRALDSDTTHETKMINGGGRTLMPGLVDSHVHFNLAGGGGLAALEGMHWEEIGSLAAYAAREWFMEGFTTVRDMGGMYTGLKKTIDKGLLVGPRIYTAGGFISQTGGHGDLRLDSQTNTKQSNIERLGITHIADGCPEVIAAARKSFSGGAVFLKVMVGGGIASQKDPFHSEQYTSDEINAAVDVAKSWDTYVAVHVYQNAHTKRALDLGVKSIEHGHLIDEATAILIKEKGAFLSPNLAGMHPETLKHPLFCKPGPQRTKVMQFHKSSTNFIEIVNKIKPKVVFNTDIAFSDKDTARASRSFEKWTHAELFGNLSALKALTSAGGELAALTGMTNPYPGKIGVIEEGALADLLIVDGNPLDDITVIGAHPKWFDAAPRKEEGIETIRLIMKDGNIYKNTLDRI